ncbi:hypothetical protein LTR86_002330 [Recurvomyces mirabilis]|nr:hypothetical protein LTR86_002330 [Recurvomyces mirabilis]
MAGRKRKAEADEGDGRAKKKVVTPSDRITLSMQTAGPRRAVFNTAELLEAILLFVPMKAVFACQRMYVANVPYTVHGDILEWSVKRTSKLVSMSYTPDFYDLYQVYHDLTLGEVVDLFVQEAQHAAEYAMWGNVHSLGEDIGMVGRQKGRRAILHALQIWVANKDVVTNERH